MTAHDADLLKIIEAAYVIDIPDSEWLRNVAAAVRPHLDAGFGLAAFEFLRAGDGTLNMLQSQHLWMPEPLAEAYPSLFANMSPELRRRPFDMGPCVTGSQMMGMRGEFANLPLIKAGMQRFGMSDSVWITATDPTGFGCGFHAGRRVVRWATRRESRRWGRIAAHLASAVRIRHRLKLPDSEQHSTAILEPNGKVCDATGSARERSALDALRKAVLDAETARGPQRTAGADEALDRWKALVSGRWSLLDQFESDGRRYIVARQNEPRARGPEALSDREKQVVGYAKLGHHNKLIAYELGVADSTVRVLMSRAASKIGVRTRDELVAAATRFELEPPVPVPPGSSSR